MHIKQVIISGFRSFRNQPEVEHFSSKHNVIVGKNGSGKSNFFDAIRFVLVSEGFKNLNKEERQQLLHEGVGATVVAAFVEVVFDNSDGRLAIDGDEVVLRRTIGSKKDEFFLNRKRVTKSEVTSLLESAGFSRSNPYYIVQQGKVNALCLMTDEKRLDLLKEVAGTRVYEERREESLKHLQDASAKREKIDETFAEIEDRLHELEDEKEELKEYQKLDREKRALEYTIYDKELRKARDQIDEIEGVRADHASKVHELSDSSQQIQDELVDQGSILSTARKALERVQEQKSELETSRTSLIRRRAKLEVDVREMEEAVATDQESQEFLHQEAVRLDKQILEAQTKLDKEVQPEFQKVLKKKSALESRRGTAQLNLNELLAKQGRGSRFDSVKERDDFLKKQLTGLERSISEKEISVKKLEKKISDLSTQISRVSTEVSEKEEDIQERQAAQEKLSHDLGSKNKQKLELAENLKRQHRATQAADDEVRKCEDELKQFERDLRSALPYHIAQGLAAVERIVAEEKIKGYYGPLVSNFTLRSDKYAIPVEVSAGNSLFHVIVEDDEVAAKLIQRLSAGNLGRLTFMPLRRLNVKRVEYPSNREDGVAPLFEKAFTFDPKFENAMRQVFGKKLLAKSFEVAQRVSREYNLDAVTMDGDQVNRKGAMEGGYRDERHSKLKSYIGVQEMKARLEAAKGKWQATKAKTTEAEQTVTKMLSSIQIDGTKLERMKDVIKQFVSEVQNFKKDLSDLEDQKQRAQEKLPSAQAELESIVAQATSYRNEIGSALQSSLSSDEKAQLDQLRKEIENTDLELETITTQFDEISHERQGLKALLRDNLLKQRDEIQEKLSSSHGGLGGGAEVDDRVEKLVSRQREFEDVSKEAGEVTAELQDLEQQFQDVRTTVQNCEKKIEELKTLDAKNQDELAEADKETEKQLTKRSMLVQKREENLKKIQQLGSLPAAELEKFSADSVKQLMKKLHKVNQDLSRYAHVNKKALDQYLNATEEHDKALKIKEKLDTAARKIEEMIEALDRQKDEAILRTFKGVSKHFAEVFKEIVPLGQGQLTMRTSVDRTEDDEELPEPSVSDFEGVQVRVSFTSAGEVYLMSQLSGGQKALVALSLIFAIQRCDPAPFYLFDELDQALDSTYRAAVAAMIERQANAESSTQFITTTFRPELVNAASKCYQIRHQEKNSIIQPLTRSAALSFVAELLSEVQAEGKPQSTPRNQAAQEESEDESHGESDLEHRDVAELEDVSASKSSSKKRRRR